MPGYQDRLASPTVTSRELTPDQIARLAESIGALARYLNRLCRRMESAGFPAADPLYRRALHARNAAEGLHAAICEFAES